LYLACININYSASEITSPLETSYYRWFYTSRVFNEIYSTKKDFNLEYPNLDVTIDAEIVKNSSNRTVV
jgi:hypothetical protein